MAIQDFLLNTDYPVEKIIGSVSGSFTRNTTNYLTSEYVPHNLSFTPLYILQWSNSPSFVPTYSEQLSGDGNSPLLEAQTNSTDVVLYAFVPSGTITFYYRVLLFMPPDVNADSPATDSMFDNLSFSSDYDSPKIFREGKITSTSTIVHDLGFYPLVDFWIHRVSDGALRHFPVSETDSGNEGGAIVTTTTATFYLLTGHDYIYYKIYGNET